eukprot:scaffold253905_cov33-Tisochrysis_lutea.AAC.2
MHCASSDGCFVLWALCSWLNHALAPSTPGGAAVARGRERTPPDGEGFRQGIRGRREGRASLTSVAVLLVREAGCGQLDGGGRQSTGERHSAFASLA